MQPLSLSFFEEDAKGAAALTEVVGANDLHELLLLAEPGGPENEPLAVDRVEVDCRRHAHSHKHGLDDWARAQDARSRITGWGRTGDAVIELDVGLGALRIEPGVVSLGIFPRSAVQRLLP